MSHSPPAATIAAPNSGYGTKGYRSFVLGALLIVYIFNFIDRTIINILTEPIKASFGLEHRRCRLPVEPDDGALWLCNVVPDAVPVPRRGKHW